MSGVVLRTLGKVSVVSLEMVKRYYNLFFSSTDDTVFLTGISFYNTDTVQF